MVFLYTIAFKNGVRSMVFSVNILILLLSLYHLFETAATLNIHLCIYGPGEFGNQRKGKTIQSPSVLWSFIHDDMRPRTSNAGRDEKASTEC
jgi:hypothetical protein